MISPLGEKVKGKEGKVSTQGFITPNIVLSCKMNSLWIVCNRDLKQITMATAIQKHG